MPDLDVQNILAFKSKLLSMQPSKTSLTAIDQRFDICVPKYLGMLVKYRKYEMIKNVISLNDHLRHLIAYVDVMIDNADMYYEAFSGVTRESPSEGYVHASTDVYTVNKAATKCIDIVDNHNKLK